MRNIMEESSTDNQTLNYLATVPTSCKILVAEDQLINLVVLK
jgi:hypothetical protein